MKIKKQSNFKKNIIKIIFRFIFKIENIGNGNFRESGETKLIDKLIDFYSKNQKNFRLLDLGANYGEYFNYFLGNKLLKKYEFHVFEPQKKCFLELKNKFGNNKNIFLNNFGISSENKVVPIYFNEEGSGLASLYKRDLKFYKLNMDDSESIFVKRLDEYIVSHNIEKINLLKIDVEGNELNVLNSLGDFLNNNLIDFIQFEYGGSNIDSRTNLLDFFRLLEGKNFVLCRILKSGNLEIRSYDPILENFVSQNWVAVSSNFLESSNF